jgi:uncharacterized protein
MKTNISAFTAPATPIPAFYAPLSNPNQKLLINIHCLTAGFEKNPACLEFFSSVMASLSECGNSRLNLTIANRFGVCGNAMTEENQKDAVSGGEERADDANALFLLGTRYSTGRDVEQDLVAAHKWFNLAAMMGHDEARRSRAELADEMSTAQIAEAQRQARAWLWNRSARTPEETPAAPATPVSKTQRRTPVSHGTWQQRGSLCA